MSALHVSLIQTALHWEDKQANLTMFEKKIRALQQPNQLVVLPEMFSTGFSMKPEALAEPMDGPTVQWMRSMAAEARAILTGSVIIEEEGNYYNRLIWMLPTGQYGYYDKRHLFAFGEEDQHYTAGNRRLIASVNGWKINLLVCYDLRFPVWARQHYDEDHNFEYDLLIYVANWPERRNTAWKTLLRARAIENQCYVIGVNRVGEDGNGIYHSGDSALIDPLGQPLYEKAHEEDTFSFTLHKETLNDIRHKFQFNLDADRFELLP